MADPVEKDHTKVNAAPESTWGSTPEAKAAWERKHGPAARKAAERAERSENSSVNDVK